MRKLDHLQTMALTYQGIVQGERPWTAPGNFMNDQFEHAKDKRPHFDFPFSYKPEVRERLIQETPEQFSRRNIYCGNRMFANKYEFVEEYRRLFPRTPALS